MGGGGGGGGVVNIGVSGQQQHNNNNTTRIVTNIIRHAVLAVECYFHCVPDEAMMGRTLYCYQTMDLAGALGKCRTSTRSSNN